MQMGAADVERLTLGEFIRLQAAWNRAHDPKRRGEPRTAISDDDLARADADARARGERVAGHD